MRRRGFGEYEPPAGPEAETEPGSRGRVLRNRLGVRRKREMDVAEYEALLRTQDAYLEQISAETRFTASLLRQMHRDWLGEIDEWARNYRTLELSKAGFHWPPARLVPENMARFEAGLLREHTPCLPAPLPSSVGFGGDDLTHLYITTAGESWTSPMAPPGYDFQAANIGGSLYRIRTEVQGKPEHLAGLIWA